MNTPETRKKAQEVFEQSNLIIGQKMEFDAAFPEIESCLIVVEESGRGIPEWKKGQPRAHRNLGEYINCSNPQCNGGFNVGSTIDEMVRKKIIMKEGFAYCFGHEGSPKRRRIYGRCNHSIHYKITIKYRQKEIKMSETLTQ